MRESYIEKKSCEYAKKIGWGERKFTSPARRAVPDRIFFRDGFSFFIEFKSTGKKATPAQLNEHVKLRKKGMSVFVSDDIEDAKFILDVMSP